MTMGISSGLFQQENKTKMNIAAASFRCHIVLALLSLSEVIKGNCWRLDRVTSRDTLNKKVQK